MPFSSEETLHDRGSVTELTPITTISTSYVDVPGAFIIAKDLGSEGNYIVSFSLLISASLNNTSASFRVLVNGTPSPDRPMTIRTKDLDIGRTIAGDFLNVFGGDEIQFQWKTSAGTLTLSEYTIVWDGVSEIRVVK